MHPRAPKLLEDIRSAAEFVESATDGLVLQEFKQNNMLEIYTAERVQEFDVAEAELSAVLVQMQVKP